MPDNVPKRHTLCLEHTEAPRYSRGEVGDALKGWFRGGRQPIFYVLVPLPQHLEVKGEDEGGALCVLGSLDHCGGYDTL